MKKKVLSIILMISIISIHVIDNKYDELIEERRDIDKYIAFNISSEMEMLFLIIDEINETILVNDDYKNMENAEIEEFSNKVSKRIFLINSSISELYLLNENYELNLDNLYNF